MCEDGREVGCIYLKEYITRVKPKLVVCGHIHNAYGSMDYNGTKIINSSICDEAYKASNKPITVEVICSGDSGHWG